MDITDYEIVPIKKIHNYDLKNEETLYDITVDNDDHSFFIKLPNSNIDIIAHNCDGSHIASLMINFFYKWKELFDLKKVFIVTSPRYIFTKNKGKKTEERIYCYNKEEYENIRDKYKDYEVRYIKGLGSLREKEFRDVLDNTDRWLCVNVDEPKCLDIMFSDNVEERRKIMGI